MNLRHSANVTLAGSPSLPNAVCSFRQLTLYLLQGKISLLLVAKCFPALPTWLLEGHVDVFAAECLENVFLELFLSQALPKADYSWLAPAYNEKLPAMLKYTIHSVKNC